MGFWGPTSARGLCPSRGCVVSPWSLAGGRPPTQQWKTSVCKSSCLHVVPVPGLSGFRRWSRLIAHRPLDGSTSKPAASPSSSSSRLLGHRSSSSSPLSPSSPRCRRSWQVWPSSSSSWSSPAGGPPPTQQWKTSVVKGSCLLVVSVPGFGGFRRSRLIAHRPLDGCRLEPAALTLSSSSSPCLPSSSSSFRPLHPYFFVFCFVGFCFVDFPFLLRYSFFFPRSTSSHRA